MSRTIKMRMMAPKSADSRDPIRPYAATPSHARTCPPMNAPTMPMMMSPMTPYPLPFMITPASQPAISPISRNHSSDISVSSFLTSRMKSVQGSYHKAYRLLNTRGSEGSLSDLPLSADLTQPFV